MTTLGLVVRCLHLAASVQLVGAFVFLLAIARPAFARAGPPARDVATALDRRLVHLAGWMLAMAILTALAGLALYAASVTGAPGAALAPGVLAQVVGHTQYGRIWLVRVLVLALLGALLVFRGQREDNVDWWISTPACAGDPPTPRSSLRSGSCRP
ncbi:MAG: hypothetical protein ACREKB_01735 [Candidatus Rokuibacteriota bacterium]